MEDGESDGDGDSPQNSTNPRAVSATRLLSTESTSAGSASAGSASSGSASAGSASAGSASVGSASAGSASEGSARSGSGGSGSAREDQRYVCPYFGVPFGHFLTDFTNLKTEIFIF